jgi:hypothetical protein
MQEGTIVRKGPSWYLIYRHDVLVDGKPVRKQKMVRLAPVSPRHARKSDLKDLAREKLRQVFSDAAIVMY